MPQRNVVTSTVCLLSYVHRYQHFIRIVFGESDHDCETEIKNKAAMASTKFVTGSYLPDCNVIAFVIGKCTFFYHCVPKRVKTIRWEVFLHAV